MKKKILTLVLIGICFLAKAQDETINGKLTVTGNIKAGEYLTLTDGNTTSSIFTYSQDQNLYIGAGKDQNGNKNDIVLYNYNCSGGCNTARIRLLSDILYASGNVGIGTITPGQWRLAVNGKIRAKEVKVETNWADFVFEKDYKLPTLKEVEKHIKEKGHLKDIPNAKEVEKNGVFLGVMSSKLLQKIEELTLYTISQEKKLKYQYSKIKKLEKENRTLKSINLKLIEIQKRLEKLEKK